MPKGKKNKGKFEHRRTEQPESSDEDAGIDMNMDNCSETSGQSDLKSIQDEADTEAQEKFEEKVMETVEALNARSAAARATAFTALRAALQRRALGPLLEPHRATLADHAARAIRRGKGSERKAAAELVPLLALQIGDEGTEEFVREVRPALAAAAVDQSASVDTRTECCSSLAVLCYLLEEDLSEIMEVMRMYETIFSGSYLKGDGTVKVGSVVTELGAYHAAALDGWALLMATLPQGHAAGALRARQPSWLRLAELLQACSLEVRMSAGCALAIAHELTAESFDEAELSMRLDSVEPVLKALANDSQKFRAKRDRKLQRATFRDVLKYFEDDTVPSASVRVCGENVSLSSWSGRALYGALAASLGGGLATLAAREGPLRAALGLPDAHDLTKPVKLNKLQRHLQNNAADKARTVARNKNRDKRSAALAL